MENIFSQFYIGIDTSKTNDNSYEIYSKKENNAILFCASKHREGSDIPNLDGCIFMDHVSNRSERLFVQCIGRVLRKDKLNKKNYGLVIDLKAISAVQICNRIQYFLKLKDIPSQSSFMLSELISFLFILSN